MSTDANHSPVNGRGAPCDEAVSAEENWHAIDALRVIESLGADSREGLSSAEVAERLRLVGPNRLQEEGRVHWTRVLGRQFVDVLILILFVAAGISAAIGEIGDAVTILAIVVLNGALGFVQEWKAERALEALRSMLSPHCRVVREGTERDLDAESLVPGDLVRLSIGDRVPADLRLLDCLNLKIDESVLTGESVSVTKSSEATAVEAPLSGRKSMAWMGTAVTNGRATGVVVATGMKTEFGRIARLTQTVHAERTPLQRKLAILARQLGLISVGASLLVVLAGWATGKDALEMFLTGVALAVAVVPEGLPAVVTITLALGIRAMLRRRVLLRRLQAAEALGAANVICSDKTGTLTQGEMTVQRIWLAEGALEVTGSGYDPAGHFEHEGVKIAYDQRSDLLRLLRAGLECNNSRVYKEEDGWHELGEPTEAALVVAAYKAWLHPDESERTLSEFSFNSTRKRMTRVVHGRERNVAYVKGAPEIVLERSSRILVGDEEREMTAQDRREVTEAAEGLANSGLRTLAMADRDLPEGVALAEDDVEGDLTFLGIVGIVDPPRSEVSEAISKARSAGIRPIIITGDAAGTALAIAREVGLQVDRAVSGPELSELDDTSLNELLREPIVFARTTPEHKLRIVRLLQEAGNVVAMTGDGVNDAPALKRADIGIAMGIRGTEVARGAADMVLTDDNFASIVEGVEEGRREYDNIQKFVRYLLSSNAGEVFTIVINIGLGGPLVLLPVQILWMNLVTDGMTAVALGMEPAEPEVMRRPPRSSEEHILGWRAFPVMLGLAAWIAGGTLWLFHSVWRDGDLERARTIAFAGIVIMEKVNVFNFRSLHAPLSSIGAWSNPWIWIAVAVTVGLQFSAIYVPALQRLLHTVPLGWGDWGAILLLALPLFLVTEAIKSVMAGRRDRVATGGKA